MSALMRFLDGDSLAKVAAVSLVSAAALAAMPKGATSPPPNAGTAFSAPGRALVMARIGMPAPRTVP